MKKTSFMIHQPHDKMFKKSMSNLRVARDFFETYLPSEILCHADLETLKLEKHSFIDEHYKMTEADLVYSVKSRNQMGYFYLLCENQSNIDHGISFRLLVYMIRLIELHLTQYPDDPLPIVYPLVIYSGKEKWDAPCEIYDLFGTHADLAREVLFKPYQLIDLQHMSDTELCKQKWSGLFQFALKHRQHCNFKHFLDMLIPWLNDLARCGGTNYANTVLKYAVDGIEEADERLLIKKANELSKELGGKLMTIAEQWEQRGFEKGRAETMTIAKQWEQRGFEKGRAETMTIAKQWEQKGFEKGRAEGAAIQQVIAERSRVEGEIKMLQHFILLKFKKLPKQLESRINKMNVNELLTFSEQVLNAQTLNELTLAEIDT